MCFILSTTSLDALDIDWLGNKNENHDEDKIDQHHKITMKNINKINYETQKHNKKSEELSTKQAIDCFQLRKKAGSSYWPEGSRSMNKCHRR